MILSALVRTKLGYGYIDTSGTTTFVGLIELFLLTISKYKQEHFC